MQPVSSVVEHQQDHIWTPGPQARIGVCDSLHDLPEGWNDYFDRQAVTQAGRDDCRQQQIDCCITQYAETDWG
ncbi:MAG: hypothetical protein BroJett012_16620 [Betaproteobacteria bacterium]|nr:MAG: hypothetical protein BroJett012_16620 [Betaproteobacteria bacterium]